MRLSGRLKLEEENDHLLPSRCMNPNVTSLHDLMVETQPAKQRKRAETKVGRQELRVGLPDLGQALTHMQALLLPCRADLTVFLTLFLTTSLASTTPFLFPSRFEQTESLGRLENPFVFKLSKFRLCEHDKWTVRPTGLDIISASDALTESQRAAMAALHAVRVSENCPGQELAP